MKKFLALFLVLVLAFSMSVALAGGEGSGCDHMDSGVKNTSEKFPVSVSMAALSDRPSEIDMTATCNGASLKNGGVYTVAGGEKIVVKATSSTGVERIGYYWVENGEYLTDVVDEYKSEITITIPEAPNGTVRTLYIEAINFANKGANDNSNRTGWQKMKMRWIVEEKPEEPEEPVVKADVNAIYGSKTLAIFPVSVAAAETAPICSDRPSEITMTVSIDGEYHANKDYISVRGGEKVHAEAKANCGVYMIGYYWMEEDGTEGSIVDFYEESFDIVIPTAPEGTVRYLWIDAVNKENTGVKDDSNRTGWQGFKIIWDKVVNASYNDKTLANNSKTTVKVGEKVKLSATPVTRLVAMYYKWDDGDTFIIKNGVGYLEIPSTFEPGTHTLDITAEYSDGEVLPLKHYEFIIGEGDEPVEYDDELDIGELKK